MPHYKTFMFKITKNVEWHFYISLGKVEHQDMCWWISEMTRLKTSFANVKKQPKSAPLQFLFLVKIKNVGWHFCVRLTVGSLLRYHVRKTSSRLQVKRFFQKSLFYTSVNLYLAFRWIVGNWHDFKQKHGNLASYKPFANKPRHPRRTWDLRTGAFNEAHPTARGPKLVWAFSSIFQY